MLRGLETVRINDYLNENPPSDTLENIHSGSWISSNFASMDRLI